MYFQIMNKNFKQLQYIWNSQVTSLVDKVLEFTLIPLHNIYSIYSGLVFVASTLYIMSNNLSNNLAISVQIISGDGRRKS